MHLLNLALAISSLRGALALPISANPFSWRWKADRAHLRPNVGAFADGLLTTKSISSEPHRVEVKSDVQPRKLLKRTAFQQFSQLVRYSAEWWETVIEWAIDLLESEDVDDLCISMNFVVKLPPSPRALMPMLPHGTNLDDDIGYNASKYERQPR